MSGAVSYNAANHQRMTELRAAKIAGIAKDIPPAAPVGPAEGELLVVSWGSAYGPVAAAVEEVQREGGSVAHLQLRHLNPFPANLDEVVSRYKQVLVPENNMGQLRALLRDRCLVDAVGFCKVEGRPFGIQEVRKKIENMLKGRKP